MNPTDHRTPEWTDSELAARCALQPPDEEAWRVLWTRHYPRVVAAVKQTMWGVPPDLIQEAVSDAFLALISRIRNFDPIRSSLAAFISVVARSTAMDALRSKRYRRGGVPLTEESAQTIQASAAETLPRDLAAAISLQALRKMGDRHKRKILLRLIKGIAIHDIAAELGCSESHIRRVRLEYIEALEAALDELFPAPSRKST